MPEASIDNDNSLENLSIFSLPIVNDNPFGWGPNDQPDKYKDLPYQKFSKTDKIGKIADWTAMGHTDKKTYNKYQSQFSVGNVGQYSYFHDEDESQFTLVDQTRAAKTGFQKKFRTNPNKMMRKPYTQQYQNQARPGHVVNTKMTKQQKVQQKSKPKYQSNMRNMKQREPSVRVGDDWKVIEEIEFSRLSKLSLVVDDPVDLKMCGSMEYFDKTYDRINTKVQTAANKLKRINRVYHKVTTLDDPVIRSLSRAEGNVYATDSILATLMCCSRSVYPWDIVVTKISNKIFLDKRDDSNFDLLTVSETSSEQPMDEDKSINSPHNLALEATYINQNLTQQVLRMNEERFCFSDPNPFIEGDQSEVASVGYKYRKWDLGNGIQLIVRSEIDAVSTTANDEKIFLNIRALNEWDSKYNNGLDWRQKLDSQPGAVLAAEIKNNGCKLAKWTVCSLLAGVDQIKFGFVSRVNTRATDKHVILGMQQFSPNEFSSQIALNIDNSWAVVRCIIDILNKQKDGKYIIMKDPNKAIIRIYDIPENSFSDTEQGDQDGDEE
ncbi:Eukaryotic translation initiation factor 3 subunit D [Brachionus plicatilis]|uniref:Eukaryotic translation initiation factor 3 subunit D n=1 Tax=Brachionus plicatilis TaxID=10195 RepID=A0A3M7QY92_BRAPC|nr:Eukaryotic translation initiation factor 3 subunit D [Brachionus plicatilis]